MMTHNAMDHDDSASREIERLRLEVRAAERRGAERALQWAWDEIGEGMTRNPHDEGRECFATEGLAALYPNETKQA